MDRRRAAILAADVVGYSRLMQANEERTFKTLQRHQHEFLEPTIERHSGRIFKVMGDGFLVEFASAEDAIQCAVAIQLAMPLRNAEIPEDRHITFRIGIHFDDVMIEGGDVYGHGVNLAARLESLAPPGGIACSQATREGVSGTGDVTFFDQGEQLVKNIKQPLRVFLIGLAELSSTSLPNRFQTTGGKPSIAVLPFEDLNGGDRRFIADGITEDIITDLSQISGLFVIARSTVFELTDTSSDVRTAAKQLGVAYAVHGSVRKAGQRLRINARLVDGTSGEQLWAARYDGAMDDIFDLQDTITREIVESLKIRVLPDEENALRSTPTDNVDAYSYYLQGRELFWRRLKGDLRLARQMFTQAIELDPNFAGAYAGIANCDTLRHANGSRDVSFEEIMACCDKAIALDDRLAEPFASRGVVLRYFGRLGEAESAFQQALERDPTNFETTYFYGGLCRTMKRHDEAADLFERASELQVNDYRSLLLLGNMRDVQGQPEAAKLAMRRALERAERALEIRPDDSGASACAASLAAGLGQTERAQELLDRIVAAGADVQVRYNVACTYARLGEAERAIDLLEEHIPNWPAADRAWMWDDPDLASLRDEPRFIQLQERLRHQAA